MATKVPWRPLRWWRSHLLHHAAHLGDRRALAQQQIVRELTAKAAVLLQEPSSLQGPLADDQQLFVLEGLLQIVVGTLLHGLDGGLGGCEGRDQQHLGWISVGADPSQEVESRLSSQLEIRDHQIDGMLFELGTRLGHRAGDMDGVPGLPEDDLQELPHRLLVIDHQELCLLGG
jgi:hypothetical protein